MSNLNEDILKVFKELKDLVERHNIYSVDISADMTKDGEVELNTFRCLYNDDTSDMYLMHKPTYDELLDLFREEDK